MAIRYNTSRKFVRKSKQFIKWLAFTMIYNGSCFSKVEHILLILNILIKSLIIMEGIFSEEERAILQSKMWWVACNVTPFLIRSATVDNTILLTITDLRTLWGTRVDEKKLMKDKQLFAKTLQVASPKQFVNLFESILSNAEQKALYKFIKKTNGDLTFEIQKQIEVYPLTWRFQLIQLDQIIVNMMCKDIINPLVRTLNAQQKRIEIMRKKMKILEQNLLKRMTQSQKVYYKSALNQDEEDLKLLVSPRQQQQFITNLRMEQRSKFFFQLSLQGSKSGKPEKVSQKQKQKAVKIQKRVPAAYANQLNADEIINELQMKKEDEREKKKKKKNLDFI